MEAPMASQIDFQGFDYQQIGTIEINELGLSKFVPVKVVKKGEWVDHTFAKMLC